MSRPPISDALKLEIWNLRRQGLSSNKIEGTMVEDRFANPKLEKVPAWRTIAKYVNMYDRLDPDLRRRDKPFMWAEMEEYGLPWEAGRYLLGLSAVVTNRNARRYWRKVLLPTVRQVRWWWRVHMADPNMPDDAVIAIAGNIALREQAHDLLGRPLTIDQLEACLAYRPWESAERWQEYDYAVREGLVPKLNISVFLGDVGADHSENLVATILAGGSIDGLPYTLPTGLYPHEGGAYQYGE